MAEKEFTPKQLSQFNGKEGRPAYIVAENGSVVCTQALE